VPGQAMALVLFLFQLRVAALSQSAGPSHISVTR
jgi:hypothetical protein